MDARQRADGAVDPPTNAEPSSPAARQRMYPALHARARVLDVLPSEEVLGLYLVDRIDRPQKIALVAERHGGIDAHAALELGVRGGPLLVGCGHALGRHEGLAAPTRDRVEDVGARIDPRGQAPHDVIHGIRIDVLADSDGEPHALRAGERGGEEIALPALVELVALLHLD